MNSAENVKEFAEKAGQVSSVVSFAESVDRVFEKCISLCLEKKACSGNGPLTIAFPDLPSDHAAGFENLCLKNGIEQVKENLRRYEKGVDLGITLAAYGIAETGTIVAECSGEDQRLASMISDLHVILLNEKDIKACDSDIEEELKKMTLQPGSYTAFITGPSRTADIERVLALGVHGPLELHIIILREEEWQGGRI